MTNSKGFLVKFSIKKTTIRDVDKKCAYSSYLLWRFWALALGSELGIEEHMDYMTSTRKLLTNKLFPRKPFNILWLVFN